MIASSYCYFLKNIMGLLDSAFKGAGLGSTLQSWIDNNQNQSISPDQVQQALGASHLLEILSDLADKLNPKAEAASPAGGLGDLVGRLSGLLDGDKKACYSCMTGKITIANQYVIHLPSPFWVIFSDSRSAAMTFIHI